MTLPARFWMPENPQGKTYVTTGPLAAPPYVECVRVDSLDGWRDIESAPKDGRVIILSNKSGSWVGVYRPQYKSGYRPDNPWFCIMLNVDHITDAIGLTPTHWMPLPAPPT